MILKNMNKLINIYNDMNINIYKKISNFERSKKIKLEKNFRSLNKLTSVSYILDTILHIILASSTLKRRKEKCDLMSIFLIIFLR